jgi:hypothetical protein
LDERGPASKPFDPTFTVIYKPTTAASTYCNVTRAS